MSTPYYLTNPIAATTTTMPPLALTPTCIAGHTQATPPPLLSLCIFFYFMLVISLHLELVQDSVGCNTAATATSPCVHTGYPVAIISPFWGMPAALWHPPLRASWVHASHCRCSPYLVPPSKKIVSPLFPSHLTSPLRTHPAALQKKLGSTRTFR